MREFESQDTVENEEPTTIATRKRKRTSFSQSQPNKQTRIIKTPNYPISGMRVWIHLIDECKCQQAANLCSCENTWFPGYVAEEITEEGRPVVYWLSP